MTPYEIRVLLHHYCSPSPFEHCGTELYAKTINMYADCGVFEVSDGSNPKVTDKGRFLVEMICSTPLPVSGGWVDPRFVKAKDDHDQDG